MKRGVRSRSPAWARPRSSLPLAPRLALVGTRSHASLHSCDDLQPGGVGNARCERRAGCRARAARVVCGRRSRTPHRPPGRPEKCSRDLGAFHHTSSTSSSPQLAGNASVKVAAAHREPSTALVVDGEPENAPEIGIAWPEKCARGGQRSHSTPRPHPSLASQVAPTHRAVGRPPRRLVRSLCPWWTAPTVCCSSARR